MLKTILGEIITDLNLKKSFCLCQFAGNNDKGHHAVPFNGIKWQSPNWNNEEVISHETEKKLVP